MPRKSKRQRVFDAMAKLGEPTITVTFSEYGNAIRLGKYIAGTHYADVYAQAAAINGYVLAQSLDDAIKSVMSS